MSIMTEEQKAFETKWYGKSVKTTGKHWQIPIKEYKVTAALLNWFKSDETIFAIIAHDYNPENKHWFTFHLNPTEVGHLDEAFEILG